MNALAAIALGMMWWSGEPWSVFGIKKPQWSNDTLLGCVVFGVDQATAIVAMDLLRGFLLELVGPDVLGTSVNRLSWVQRPEGIAGLAALLVFAVSVAFAEELIFRGFLISRFEQLLHSRVWSVVLGAAIFGLFHWGLIASSVTCLTGIIYGAAFVWTRRLWPGVIAHAMVDFDLFLYL